MKTIFIEDELLIADPCYIDGDDSLDELREYSLGVIIPNCYGMWEATVKFEDNLVSKLILQKVDTVLNGEEIPELINSNGVDSGQMFAGDINNFPLDYKNLLKQYEDSNGKWVDRPFFKFNNGVVSSTGFGDGSYPVLLWRDKEGDPMKVVVEFMSDEYD